MSTSIAKSKVLVDKPNWTESSTKIPPPSPPSPQVQPKAIQTRWHVMKETVLESAADTTCHGLPKIVTSQYWPIKIMWMFFLTLSIAYFVFGVVNNIFDFLEFNTNSVILFERKASVECKLRKYC
jgi:hypothetical protein